MRSYQNHLGLSAIRPKCILIADGPSKEKVIPFPPQEINLEEFDVAVVNKAGYQWDHVKDYWFSLHPENFPLWIPKAERVDGCIFIGFKQPRLNLSPHRYINTNYRILS